MSEPNAYEEPGTTAPAPVRAGAPGAVLSSLLDLAQLEVFASTIPVGIFRTETGRGLVYANQRLLDMLGRTDAELLGAGWSDAVHPDDRARVLAERDAALGSPEESTVEHRVLRPDGEIRWLEVRSTPLSDDAGGPVGLVGTVEDITDRVIAERDAARLSAVCERTTDFVVVSEPTGRLLYVNPSIRDALGLDSDPGAYDLDRLYAGSSHGNLAALLRDASHDGSASGELVLSGADGREIPVSQVTLAHRSLDGATEWFSTIARDISREKSTERELVLRSSMLRSLVERAADLVIVLDARGLVTDVGESIFELVGIDGGVWLGRRLSDLVHPDDAERVAAAFTATRDGEAGECHDVMYRVARADGSVIWFESRITNLLEEEAVGAIVAISWDETIRATVAQALEESEERFRSLAASSPVGIIYADREGRNRYVNARWRAIAGIGPDDAVRLEIVHPDDRERVMAGAMEVVERLETVRTEYRLVRPDGEIRDVRSSVAPIFDERREATGFVASIEDVTEEVAARAQINRLASLLESTPDFAFIADRLGRVLYANRQAAEVLGLATGLDLDFAELPMFAEASRTVVRTEMLPEVRRDGVWTGDVALRDTDGREIPVSIVTLAHHDEYGTVDFFSTIARDISELKEVEAQLSASESWFRSLVHEALDIVSVRDVDNNMVYVSPSVTRVLGVDIDEVADLSSRGLRAALSRVIEVHPDDLPAVRAAEAEVRAEAGRTVRLDYRVRHRDQSWRWIESRMTNLLDDPVVRGVVTNSQDVTERRSAEDARARSDSALLAIVQASPLAIHAVEADLSVQLWNNACEELFGWSAAEVLGRRAPFVSPESSSVADELIGRVFAGERIKDLEFPLLTRDGTLIDAVISLAPVRDANGGVVSAMGVIVDVTARKQAEKALRASEERFRALVQNSSDFTAVYTEGGAFSYASPSVARFVGFDLQAAATPSLVDLVHPDDLEVAGAGMADLAPGEQRVFECRMRRHDGAWRWMSVTATNLRDDPGVRGVVINSRDVTDGREAEDALRESEERFRALVQHGSDMLSVIDADGTVRYASPAGARVLGFEDAELGNDALERAHPEDLDRIAATFAEALTRPGITGPEQFRLRHADGSYRVIEAVANNLLDDPAVKGIIVTAHDVTERTRAEELVRRSEERLLALVQNLSDVITVVDETGQLVYTSPAANRLFGFEDGDDSWTDPLGTVHPDDMEELVARMSEQLATGSSEPIPFRIRRRDGSFRNVESIASDLLADPAVRGIVVTTRDVTDRTRAEGLVAAQARILEMVAKGSSLDDTLGALCELVESSVPSSVCSVMLVEPLSRQLVPASTRRLPEPLAALLRRGIPVSEGAGACGTAAFRREEVVATDVDTDPLFEEYRELMTDVGLRACWSTPIVASSDGRVLGTFAVYWPEVRGPSDGDVAVVDNLVHLGAIAIERKTSEQQLEFQAHHDVLTALPNRALFVEFLTLALARARRRRNGTAVLFLDLDEFKKYNDSLGHDCGDTLLVAVGQRLRAVLRPGDTIARFGGDEFTVLCEELSGPDARQHAIDVAMRLLEALQTPFVLEGQDCFLSASVGIALSTGGSEHPEDLLRDADAAMYRAKERGKNRWELFDERMRARARERLETESALHRALERGEFRLFYQPMVSLAEVRYVGVEALLRWQHPDRGLVAPNEFVKLAEETGLVVPLGAWVLAEVCRQYSQWRADPRVDPSMIVSVNLSGRQISHPDIVESIATTLERGGLPAESLCLEITESVLLDDTGPALKTLRALKELGVQLSMDDFGTGYSSLGYLKRFPIDSVKIDRSFVDGLPRDPEDSAIVAGVVSLGRALGLNVVAEGVETEEQLGALVSLGCEQAQGFYFSPPRPADEISPLLAGRGPELRIPGAGLMRGAQRPTG